MSEELFERVVELIQAVIVGFVAAVVLDNLLNVFGDTGGAFSQLVQLIANIPLFLAIAASIILLTMLVSEVAQ